MKDYLPIKELKIKKNIFKSKVRELESSLKSKFKYDYKMLKTKLNNKNLKTSDINNILLPYNDRYFKLIDQINSLINTNNKNILHNFTNNITNKFRLKIDNIKSYTNKNFDVICDYNNRDELDENNVKVSDLYLNNNTSEYLIYKTFKKNALEIYKILSLFKYDNIFKNKNGDKSITVSSIGGGPGSDLVGLLCYFEDTINFGNINCKISSIIYDINSENWSSLNLNNLKEEVSKFTNIKDINIEYKYINFDNNECNDIIISDIFISSWCLNESKSDNIAYFWDIVIRNNKNSIFIFLEGESKPLDIIENICKIYKLEYYYERHKNPRFLLINNYFNF